MPELEMLPHSWREGESMFVRAHLAVVPMPVVGDQVDGEPDPIQRFRVLPWGEHELSDRTFREYWGEPGIAVVDERSAAEIPANFAAREIDYFVNTDHWGGRAYGWITSVEVLDGDGVYLNVDWTPDGEKLVRDRAYRYNSAEVIWEVTRTERDGIKGRVVAIVGDALTNHPAVTDQAPMTFSSLSDARLGRAIREPSADGTRTARFAVVDPGETPEKGTSTMSDTWKNYARVLGVQAEDEDQFVAHLHSLRGQAAEGAKVAELTTQLEAATARGEQLADELETAKGELETKSAALAKLEAEGREHQVDEAIREGLLSNAQRDWAIANFEAFEALEPTLSKNPQGPPLGRVVQATGGKPDTFDAAGERAELHTAVLERMKADAKLGYDQALEAEVAARRATQKGA